MPAVEFRVDAGQQVWLDGAILRLNPSTGEAAPAATPSVEAAPR